MVECITQKRAKRGIEGEKKAKTQPFITNPPTPMIMALIHS
jgi:hypothetical protein